MSSDDVLIDCLFIISCDINYVYHMIQQVTKKRRSKRVFGKEQYPHHPVHPVHLYLPVDHHPVPHLQDLESKRVTSGRP